MGIGKAYKRNLIIYFVILIIFLSGCKSRKQEELNTSIETERLDSINTQTEERIAKTKEADLKNTQTKDSKIDYSVYLKKIWIVDGWREQEEQISCIFTNFDNGRVEGYYSVNGMVIYGYDPYDGAIKASKFDVTLCDRSCEFEFQEKNRKGQIVLTFSEESKIETKLIEGDKIQDYMLRPYNIKDETYRDEPTIFKTELDSWGSVYLFYAHSDSSHSIPEVLLINEQGDILYWFSAGYHHASEVFDVVVKDINGDGLKDVDIITYFSYAYTDTDTDTGSDLYEWLFYQKDNGLFYRIDNGLFPLSYMGLENVIKDVKEGDKIEELISKLQFSLERIEDKYELKLYDPLGNEVYSMMYPYSNKPYIEKVTESILEIGVYTGSPALNVFYFDKVSGETSIGYMNPIYVDGKYIAYMEQDKLIFAEIFNEEIYLEIIKEFSPAITPVTNIKMLDSETILVQYYTGENFIEVQEEISIKELTTNKTIINYP